MAGLVERGQEVSPEDVVLLASNLLPYDGIADWDINVERLKKSNKLEVLNFELNISSKPDRHDNDVYTEMSLERYFTEAYKRACKIAYKYSK